MKPETNYLDRTKACYEVEYDLRKDLHYKEGEILKLEYINAKHCREIERLNKEMTEDDKRAYPISSPDLFHYLKALLIELSSEDGMASINPDNIDVKYIEAASRYCYPVLFDKYAVLDQDDSVRHKIELANSILEEFGIETMEMYERFMVDGDIDLKLIDRRDHSLGQV